MAHDSEYRRDIRTRSPARIVELICSAAMRRTTYYVRDPPPQWVRAIGRGIEAADDPPTVRLLVAAPRLEQLEAAFLAATEAARQADDGPLSIRRRTTATGEPVEQPETPLVLGEGAVHALLSLPDGRGARLSGRGGSFEREARERCEREWADSEPAALEVPARDRLRRTLTETFGEAVGRDFDGAVSEARPETAFDPVVAALLVGARHELTHQAVANWCDRVGVTDVTAVTTHRRRLESMGVLEPAASGAGRLRLTSRSQSLLADHSIGTLVRRASDRER